ncbi:MAG: hypothetical protein LBR69_03630 [Endomicrobium sp.]|jgi:hypothetical protein|nr:hypothetical protein [Endomicrobium sp.]
MKHFYIIDKNGNDVVKNLTGHCVDCFKSCNSVGRTVECSLYKQQFRYGKITNSKSITFLCDTTKTTKLFREKLEALSYAYYDLVIAKEEIEQKIKIVEQKKVNRLIHNLSSINAHNLQSIYDIIPQEQLSSNWQNQNVHIEKEIKRNTDKIAKAFLQLEKNAIRARSEFSVYRKLDRDEKSELDFKSLKIHSVLLNVFHTFFYDFLNIKVYINISEYFGKVKIDYETIQVALYHLIENAAKYIKKGSHFSIWFEEDNQSFVKVNFKMTSIFVAPDERKSIFEEGVSGSIAKKIKKSGDGIGMWRIGQMVKLNNGEFFASFGDKTENINGCDYAENTFTLVLMKGV